MEMKKVLIINCPGSGKSTFARKFHAATSLNLSGEEENVSGRK